jgi:hypothetical protein
MSFSCRMFINKHNGDGSCPRNRPWGPAGLRDVEDSTLYKESAIRWRRDCLPPLPAALYSPEEF